MNYPKKINVFLNFLYFTFLLINDIEIALTTYNINLLKIYDLTLSLFQEITNLIALKFYFRVSKFN